MSLRFWMYVVFIPLGLSGPFIHSLESPALRIPLYFAAGALCITAIEILNYAHRRIVSRAAARAARLASQQANQSGPDGMTDDLRPQFQL